MFQRHRKARHAGFIRRIDNSRMNQTQIYREEQKFNLPISSQFSPFKDESPEPIDKILQNYGHKNTSRFQQLVKQFQVQHRQHLVYDDKIQVIRDHKKQKKRKNNTHKHYKNQSFSLMDNECTNDYYELKQNYHRDNQTNKKCQKNQRRRKHSRHQKPERQQKYEKVQQAQKTRAIIITQSNEQIQQISIKPEIFTLSLAESFNIHCQRMRQKLENERVKFSKSKYKENRELSRSMQIPKSLKNKPSFDSTTNTSKNNQNVRNQTRVKNYFESVNANNKNRPEQQRRERPHRSTSLNQNKQNCHQSSNLQCINLEPKTARASPNKQSKFFIPMSSHRSKPITPRQAYEHSLKKWKQLPEVVARQKQRQKQQHMRQRLSKMKAHSIEVRQKLRKSNSHFN